MQNNDPPTDLSSLSLSPRLPKDVFAAAKLYGRDGPIEKILAYLDEGGDIDARLEYRDIEGSERVLDGPTLLHGAAQGGKYDLVELLVARGADVNLRRCRFRF